MKTKIEELRNDLLNEAERIKKPDGQAARIARKLTAILADGSTLEEGRSTPPNRWVERGEKDPHGSRYDCERGALTLGQYTDDELANGAFMNYNVPLDIKRALTRDHDYHPPIAWMTAVKDRIRWLSRALSKEQEKNKALQEKYDACSGGKHE